MVEAAVFSTDRPEELLFNVAEDPNQLNNLAANPEHKQRLQRLRGALGDWQARTGDSIPEVEQMTPDRHDRVSYEKLYPGKRPSGGMVAGQQAGAESL